MTQNKILGKFYPLQNEEWLYACRELTQAQLAVLYYIRTNDPYNQGIEINCAEIARLLSKPERIVHRQTISRALKELDAKGFIDLELLQVKAKVMAKGIWCDDAPKVCEDTKGVTGHQRCDDAPSVIATHPARSLHTTVDHDAPSAIATHHTESESLAQSEFQTSNINKTYLDFIRSLSDSERENFLEFGKKKAAELPNPPALALKWIEAHFEELKEVWLKEREQSNCAHASSPSNTSNTSSTKVQNFELWESSSHEGQYHALMSLGLAKFCENRTSKSWYEWAKVKFPERFIDIPE